MPFDLVCDDDLRDRGQIIEFLEDFKVYEEDGMFHIDDLVIDTNDMDNDYDE